MWDIPGQQLHHIHVSLLLCRNSKAAPALCCLGSRGLQRQAIILCAMQLTAFRQLERATSKQLGSLLDTSDLCVSLVCEQCYAVLVLASECVCLHLGHTCMSSWDSPFRVTAGAFQGTASAARCQQQCQGQGVNLRTATHCRVHNSQRQTCLQL